MPPESTLTKWWPAIGRNISFRWTIPFTFLEVHRDKLNWTFFFLGFRRSRGLHGHSQSDRRGGRGLPPLRQLDLSGTLRRVTWSCSLECKDYARLGRRREHFYSMIYLFFSVCCRARWQWVLTKCPGPLTKVWWPKQFLFHTRQRWFSSHSFR